MRTQTAPAGVRHGPTVRPALHHRSQLVDPRRDELGRVARQGLRATQPGLRETRSGEQHPADQHHEKTCKQEQDPGAARDGHQAPRAECGPHVGVRRGEVPGELGRADLGRSLLQVRPQGGREVELEAIALSHRGAPS